MCMEAKIMKVAIFLCTYNGQKFLSPQLNSFKDQTHTNWELHVSDDGSKDETEKLLQNFQKQAGLDKVFIYSGPKKGFVANFLSLSHNSNIQADLFAFSDQDDIWEAQKLEKAVSWLQTVPSYIPALYCSRTRLVNANDEHIKYSSLYSKKALFTNALVQNISSGNTMVFNQAARELLNAAGCEVPFHDWLLYQVVTGCGGEIFYDAYPSVRYRQHGGNVTGAGYNLSAICMRVVLMMQGCFKSRNDQNIKALLQIQEKLTPDNRQVLHEFASSRKRGLLPRLLGIKRAGIYRQTTLGNVGLLVAILFNRI